LNQKRLLFHIDQNEKLSLNFEVFQSLEQITRNVSLITIYKSNNTDNIFENDLHNTLTNSNLLGKISSMIQSRLPSLHFSKTEAFKGIYIHDPIT